MTTRRRRAELLRQLAGKSGEDVRRMLLEQAKRDAERRADRDRDAEAPE